MTAALLFLISKGNKAIVDSFAQDWLSGNRNYARNKNFDVLMGHLQSVRNKNNGHLNRTVLAAALVHTFNYWHANIVATPKALHWRKEWQFPRLAFDKAAFLHERERRNASDSSLPALQERMLKALHKLQDKDGNVELPVGKIAQESGVPERQVSYVLSTLKDDNLVHLSRKQQRGKQNLPAIWRLKEAGMQRAMAA